MDTLSLIFANYFLTSSKLLGLQFKRKIARLQDDEAGWEEKNTQNFILHSALSNLVYFLISNSPFLRIEMRTK